MHTVRFIDTTFRDSRHSLWAEGMTTGMMRPIAAQMGAAGYEHMEVVRCSEYRFDTTIGHDEVCLAKSIEETQSDGTDTR